MALDRRVATLDMTCQRVPSGRGGVRLLTPAEDRMTDEELIARGPAWRDDTFRRLHHRYEARLLLYLRHRGRFPWLNVQDVEDVAQETWLKVHEYLFLTFSGDSFRAWFFQIAHNCAVSKGRKELRVRRDAEAGPERHFQKREVLGLPPDQLERPDERTCPARAAMAKDLMGQCRHVIDEILGLSSEMDLPPDDPPRPRGRLPERDRLFYALLDLRRAAKEIDTILEPEHGP